MNHIGKSFKTYAVAAGLTLSLVTGVGSTFALAEGYNVGYPTRVIRIADWDTLNIRKWPAHYSQKVGNAQPNAKVWVERCIVKPGASDWCKISWMHQYGWVNSRYLDLY